MLPARRIQSAFPRRSPPSIKDPMERAARKTSSAFLLFACRSHLAAFLPQLWADAIQSASQAHRVRSGRAVSPTPSARLHSARTASASRSVRSPCSLQSHAKMASVATSTSNAPPTNAALRTCARRAQLDNLLKYSRPPLTRPTPILPPLWSLRHLSRRTLQRPPQTVQPPQRIALRTLRSRLRQLSKCWQKPTTVQTQSKTYTSA